MVVCSYLYEWFMIDWLIDWLIDDTINYPYDIANTFNNYFASIPQMAKKKKKKKIHINIFSIIFQMKIVVQ